MNRLQLCQRLMLECGISGTLASTINQTGEFNRVVTWIDQAWNDVQTQHDDWDWMRSSNVLGAGASFPTVAGQASYQLGTGTGKVGIETDNFGKWDLGTFRVYTTSLTQYLDTETGLIITAEDGSPIATFISDTGFLDETFLDSIAYDAWRDAYMFGAQRQVQTRPVAAAVGPNKSVCLGPPPNGNYTVTADYFVAPSAMATDTDLPAGLPKQFHMLIVYGAMKMYGRYEAAPEVKAGGDEGWTKMLAQLENTNMPRMEFTGALV